MDIMRNSFTINMAGLIIEINSISPRACIHCMNYLCEGIPDISISINNEDILREKRESAGISTNPISLEKMAVYRKISEALLEYDYILMHGAVVAIEQKAYMFSAPSGTGKTTHIKQWLRNRSDTVVVNGDKPLIKVGDQAIVACGTPWSGNENMNSNIMVPIDSIVFMKQSSQNNIREISFIEAYPYIVQQTYIPYNLNLAKTALSLIERMNGKAKFWSFCCNNFKSDSYETSYSALCGKQR